FVEIARSPVEKDESEMTTVDYNVSRISLGGSTHEGDVHNLRESAARLVERVEKGKQTQEQMEEHVRLLSSYIQTFLDPKAPPTSSTQTVSLIKKFDQRSIEEVHQFSKQGMITEAWVEGILMDGCKYIHEVSKTYEYIDTATQKIDGTLKAINNEISHWENLLPGVRSMANSNKNVLLSKG
ncbi:hypothetical protein KI387_042565, partial [Taxus chinensis]